MKNWTHLSMIKNIKPVALYSSEQLYAMEQAWFARGYDSFGLMQQAAWQMAQQIELLYEQKCLNFHNCGTFSYSDKLPKLWHTLIYIKRQNCGTEF